jgi:YlmC/YmxH family sporulation protein
MRISELKTKEVINICDCRRLGYVGDVDFDMESGCLLAIIVPGPGCFCGFLVREKEYIIPFCDIRQVGPDIILVNVDLDKATEKCGI